MHEATKSLATKKLACIMCASGKMKGVTNMDDDFNYKFGFTDYLIITAIALGWLAFFALLITIGVLFFVVAGTSGLFAFSLITLMIGIFFFGVAIGSVHR